ncbi:hypothetical protein [Pseudomonas fluorescens]|uniref:Uncharacterized protein n=1 Tax=Pseudomonas fluorescens TaxID=294 RepID=A0A944DRJ0_PSEFL|nr:hypothetical protein [Pseudomonas fluorescens]MBT2295712.1 hypothetical protein [Pseudomonas fluorescens]MBT2305969.1 hypothetical protein [Pseudomonas fluorescens]MBT2314674.1 hypothetical protein [Pseudomonas fluorescens]MBT2315577.1 hypothetical protein [Pseudomonas fluorescens]MBT2331414.1 hypothetical protein [Pseudomonas fluorescens]
MNKEDLADRICGIGYPCRIHKDLIQIAKGSGLVIVYGASDDLMKFEGAACEEISCYDGGTALVDAQGVLPDRDSIDDDDELQRYFKRKAKAKPIEALWCKEPGYSWTYKTDIPHATFEVLDDVDRYCRGIVFALADLS